MWMLRDNIGDTLRDFYIKARKKSFNSRHLFEINKDVLDFRKELHIEILENFNSKLKTSKTSVHIMKRFHRLKPFSIATCDKNVGSDLIYNDLYTKISQEFLRDDISYTALSSNSLEKTIKIINLKLDELFINMHLSIKLRDCLKPSWTEN